ncbi:MAG: hypothetical protein EXR79_05850 [Myxococcales bacterium]|nr:hypothetical protein [Myxococcales bacterium]
MTPQQEVFGQVDDAHATDAEFAHDAVASVEQTPRLPFGRVRRQVRVRGDERRRRQHGQRRARRERWVLRLGRLARRGDGLALRLGLGARVHRPRGQIHRPGRARRQRGGRRRAARRFVGHGVSPTVLPGQGRRKRRPTRSVRTSASGSSLDPVRGTGPHCVRGNTRTQAEAAMLAVGIIAAAIGGLLFFLAKRANERVHHMKATDTARIGEVRARVDAVRTELGGGPSELREYLEFKGTVACLRPLRAELSGQAAAIVQTTVTRDFEQYVDSRDSQGNVTSRWERRSDTVHSTRLEAPFQIDDGSGGLDVRPSGADATLQTVVDRQEQAGAVEMGGGLRFGSLSVGLGIQPFPAGQVRVIGYRLREAILPVGAQVYALGEVSDTGDGLALHKPGTGDKPFVLSVKSEEELVRSSQSSAKGLVIAGWVLVAGGVVLALVGAVQG